MDNDKRYGSEVTSDIPKQCSLCGAAIKMVAKPGRTYELVRGVALHIPEDFELPTCTRASCGEESTTPSIETKLHSVLSKQLAAELSDVELAAKILKRRQCETLAEAAQSTVDDLESYKKRVTHLENKPATKPGPSTVPHSVAWSSARGLGTDQSR